MKNVPLSEAQSHLAELVDSVAAGQEFLLTRGGQALAMLTASPRPSLSNIGPISVGTVLCLISPDDDLLEEMTTS